MTHTREDQPLRGKTAIRRFGWVAALSVPWLALLGFLAYLSRFLTDDAFISFRYARNLLEGNGLVWNPGERVEGYSNFLWVLELAAIWAATGVPPEDAVWWLSAAYTVATLAAMAWWAWKLPSVRSRGLVWWMALGLLCASATFAVWTTGGGLETRQFTFFVVLAVVALTAHQGSRRGLLVASLSLALASLTRPEGPLIAACCFAWWAAQELADGERGGGGERRGGVRGWALETLRRIDWRGALALALPFLLIVGAHFLWRYSYYNEWLPNTYYAKYVRPWWDIGLQYLAAAGAQTGLYLLLPLGAGAAWGRWRERRDLAYALPLLIIALHAAYLARIGGNIYDWRPMDFYWPLLALPAADGLARVGSSAAGAWGRLRASSAQYARAWVGGGDEACWTRKSFAQWPFVGGCLVSARPVLRRSDSRGAVSGRRLSNGGSHRVAAGVGSSRARDARARRPLHEIAGNDLDEQLRPSPNRGSRPESASKVGGLQRYGTRAYSRRRNGSYQAVRRKALLSA